MKKLRFRILVVIAISLLMSSLSGCKNQNNELVIENNNEIINDEDRKQSSDEERIKFDGYQYQEIESFLSEEEKEALKENARNSMKLCLDIYNKISFRPRGYDNLMSCSLSQEEKHRLVQRLGDNGLVAVADNENMSNYQQVEEFYEAYTLGKPCEITIYNVRHEGTFGAQTFIFKNDKLQYYYISIGKLETGEMEIFGTLANNVLELTMTKKGYLIYQKEVLIAHGHLREYFRIKPLSEELRELTKKYVDGISFVDYKLFNRNWDSSSISEVLEAGLFNTLYYKMTNSHYTPVNGRIEGKVFEETFTTMLPVAIDMLRQHCSYDEATNTYDYQFPGAIQYAPFGEVVDYYTNSDGTITLIVDGVWTDYNSDYGFVNKIVVKQLDDGKFRYMSNKTENKELELPHR